jgi:trimethylamine--corrinoid protein Co-methyltransferase
VPRPVLSLLTLEEAKLVHSKSLEVLSTIGVRFEDPEVAKIVIEAGGVERGGRVLIPEELVNEALRATPRRIELYSRDGERITTLGDSALIFNPGSAAIKILDYGSKSPRAPNMNDLKKLVILVENLPHIQAQSTALVPDDVPLEIRDAVRLYPILKYSKKPIVTGAFTVENLPIMLKMLKAVREDAWKRPFAIFDVCPSPPLSWSTVTSRNLVDLARTGVPAEIISMPGLGTTAPVTVAGALVQHHAEVLSGVVLAQLVSKGAPVIYGGSPLLAQPRYGTPLIVAPEALLISLGYRDMARLLDLPVHTYMGLSDAKLVDYQAGAESAYSSIIAVLGGFDVISGPGMLEFESVFSLEKLILDNEMCGIVKRVRRGFGLSPEEMALDVIRETVLEKSGNYLLHSHTRRLIRREVHLPRIWDTAPRSRWPSRDIYEEAHLEVERILAEGTINQLESELQEKLDSIYQELYERVNAKPVFI